MSKIYGFERQPYSRELEATVLRCVTQDDQTLAILDDTILYPEGGGQPSDLGSINGLAVFRVEKRQDELVHVVEAPIAPGRASIEVDWPRRYDHMQQHTAQHLLTRTALDRFGWSTRSFHIGPATSDIELDCDPPPERAIEELEDEVARIIVEGRPIRCYRVSPEEYERLEVRSRGLPAGHSGDIRLVDIRGFDLNTCGGTHVRSTAEVEGLKIVSSEPLRGGCRLSWVAGKRLRRRLAEHDRRLHELRTLLDSSDEDLASIVRLKMEQLAAERRSSRQLAEQLAGAIADRLRSQMTGLVEIHLDWADAGLLRQIAERLAAGPATGVAFLSADQDDGGVFVVAAGEGSALDLQAIGQRLAAILEGRGGGSGRIFQGKCESLAARDSALAKLRDLIR